MTPRIKCAVSTFRVRVFPLTVLFFQPRRSSDRVTGNQEECTQIGGCFGAKMLVLSVSAFSQCSHNFGHRARVVC